MSDTYSTEFPVVSHPVPFPLLTQVRERMGRFTNDEGDVIDRDLERLYAMFRLSLHRLQLSEAEACLMVDCLRSYFHVPDLEAAICVEVEAAIAFERLDEKWGVDGAVLVAKLQDIDPGTELAIVDACERFWLCDDAPTGKVLRHLGLVSDLHWVG